MRLARIPVIAALVFLVPLAGGCAALRGVNNLANAVVGTAVNTVGKTAKAVTPKANKANSRKRYYEKEYARHKEQVKQKKVKKNFNTKRTRHKKS